MQLIYEVKIMNPGIITALSAIGAAQLMKVPIKRWRTGRWDKSALFQAGGMPSSHSAGVSALATYVGLKRGMRTVDLALAAIFGMIVMYDAAGVRRQAGEIAVEVNNLEEEVEKLVLHHSGEYHRAREKDLKEQIGHLPEEVLAGSLLGIAVGTAGYYLCNLYRKLN
jgi:acid phosphatase family membrane protein YuiD